MRFYRQSFYSNYVNAAGWDDKELTLDMILYEISDLCSENKSDIISVINDSQTAKISTQSSLTRIFDSLANGLSDSADLRDGISELIVRVKAKDSKDKKMLVSDISENIKSFYSDAKESGLDGVEEMKKKLYLLADQNYKKSKINWGSVIFFSSLIVTIGVIVYNNYFKGKDSSSSESDASFSQGGAVAETTQSSENSSHNEISNQGYQDSSQNSIQQNQINNNTNP